MPEIDCTEIGYLSGDISFKDILKYENVKFDSEMLLYDRLEPFRIVD